MTGVDLKIMARGVMRLQAEKDGAALLVQKGVIAREAAYPCFRNFQRDPIGFIARLEDQAAKKLLTLIKQREKARS